MAFFSDSLASQPRATGFASFFSGLRAVFEKIANAQNRSADVQRMEQLTDQQLADFGVRREDILRYVYRDVYYL